MNMTKLNFILKDEILISIKNIHLHTSNMSDQDAIPMLANVFNEELLNLLKRLRRSFGDEKLIHTSIRAIELCQKTGDPERPIKDYIINVLPFNSAILKSDIDYFISDKFLDDRKKLSSKMKTDDEIDIIIQIRDKFLSLSQLKNKPLISNIFNHLQMMSQASLEYYKRTRPRT